MLKKAVSVSVVLIVVWTVLGYADWKSERLIRSAETFLEKGDAERALLMARSAVSMDPENEQAQQVLIAAFDRMQDPEVLMALSGSANALRRTLKAMELGNLAEARASFSLLEAGKQVDAVSYHEMGVELYRGDPPLLYDHCLALSEEEPKNVGYLLQLVYGCLTANRPLPPSKAQALVDLAVESDGDEGADAAAAAFVMAMAWPVELAEVFREPTLLMATLIKRIESSDSIRPLFLRALESSVHFRPVFMPAMLESLKSVCGQRRQASETRKLAECLSRLRLHRELIEWFKDDPLAFPDPVIADRQAAFARLLVADCATAFEEWELLRSVVSDAPDDAWGELLFLRDFYEAMSLNSSLEKNKQLLDRYKERLAQIRTSGSSETTSQAWQRNILAQLAKRFL